MDLVLLLPSGPTGARQVVHADVFCVQPISKTNVRGTTAEQCFKVGAKAKRDKYVGDGLLPASARLFCVGVTTFGDFSQEAQQFFKLLREVALARAHSPERKQHVADSLQLMRRAILFSLWRMNGRSWRLFSMKTQGVYSTYFSFSYAQRARAEVSEEMALQRHNQSVRRRRF